MKTKSSSAPTFYSGWKSGTVAMWLLLLFISWQVAQDPKNFHLFIIGKDVLGMVSVAMLGLFMVFVVLFVTYGVRSLSLQAGELTVRNILHIARIPTDSISVITAKAVRSDHGTSYLLLVYFVDGAGNLRVQKISPITFSRRSLRGFLSKLVLEYPNVPFSKEMKKFIKTNVKIDASNPLAVIPKGVFPFSWRRFLGFSVQFSEATLFLMATSFLALLYLHYSDILTDFIRVMSFVLSSKTGKGGGIIIIFFYMAIGLFLSFYHILKRGKKSRFARTTMIFFAVGMAAGAGILSVLHTWTYQTNVFAHLISLWCIMYGIIMIMNLGEMESYYSVQSRDAKLHEIFLGLFVIAIIIAINTFYYQTYWATTFGQCIAYSSLINCNLQYFFPRLHRRLPVAGFRIPDFPEVDVHTKVYIKILIVVLLSFGVMFGANYFLRLT